MKHRTFEQWQEIVQQQKASGLSIRIFCRQNNINCKTFYNRRAKLGLGMPVKTPVHIAPTQTPALSTGFVQVKPTTICTQPTASITLKTNQATLQLPSSTSPQWIGQLLRELAA